MKRLTTLLMTLALMSAMAWAEETITVSANSSDISEGLDLKVVAKLFAEAKNLEEFETMLNNPDSAFCNLDLNGDGQVDYLRVVETGEGNKRLIVLQAILAKDIYQDVASIYVEKDEKDEVRVQVVGDEYVYGTNYIIEPVYVYRPVIYDWFWGPYWYAWTSPWYWDYYPSWWYVHSCWAHDWYWHHCYTFHHYHHYCSFRPGRTICHGYYELHPRVTRREYAVANPGKSFRSRNAGMENARAIRATGSARSARTVESSARVARNGADRSESSLTSSRTYGSRHTAVTRSETANRTGSSARSTSTATRSEANSRSGVASRGTEVKSTRSSATTATTTRPTGSSTRSTGTTSPSRTTSTTRSTGSSTRTTSNSTSTRSTSSSTVSRSSGSSTRSTSTRSSGSTYRSPSSGSHSSGSTYRGGSSSGSSRSGGSYGGGGSSRSGGSSGGGSRGGGGSVRR